MNEINRRAGVKIEAENIAKMQALVDAREINIVKDSNHQQENQIKEMQA